MALASKIKVLNIPRVGNPYYPRMYDEFAQIGCDISTDTREFFQPTSHYDILHIQFPEYLCEKYSTRSREKHALKARRYSDQLRQFRKAGTKIVWTANNLKSHHPRYHEIDRKIFSSTVEHCHGIILQAESGRSILMDKYPAAQDKILTVIHHGNYIDIYPDIISRSEARRKLSVKKDDIVFLFFGLIRGYKNLDLLVKAFNIAKDRNKTLRLFIVGQPFSKRTRIELWLLSKMNTRIEAVLKFIEKENVQNYFKASDCGIFAFKDIYMSGAVILAESFGLPVIAPRTGCIPDYVPALTGFLYDPISYRDLADKILMAADSDLHTMGKNAREFQLVYDCTVTAKAIKQFYSSL
jgi:glycosyltransferase involved in cell wall biosynthesis